MVAEERVAEESCHKGWELPEWEIGSSGERAAKTEGQGEVEETLVFILSLGWSGRVFI